MRICYVVSDPRVWTDAPTGQGSHIRMTISGFEQAQVSLLKWIGGEVSEISGRKKLYGEAKKRMPTFVGPILRGVRDLFEIVDDYRSAQRLLQRLKGDDCSFLYERQVPFRQLGYRAAKKVQIPLILEINGPMEEALRHYPSPLRAYAIRLAWKTAQRADGVVVGSKRLKNYLIERGVRADCIVVTYPTVDYEAFSAGAPARAKNDEVIRIGFVGTMLTWHGGDILIRAFQSVVARHGNVELDIIGDGPEGPRWKALAVELGVKDKVKFLGSFSFQEIPRLLSAIDICAIPNATWYGSPTKLFEYGATGKAVIGPMDTPIDEIITHRVNGFLFKKGEVGCLADGLEELVADSSMRQRLGLELQRKLKSEITWAKNIQDILALSRKR